MAGRDLAACPAIGVVAVNALLKILFRLLKSTSCRMRCSLDRSGEKRYLNIRKKTAGYRVHGLEIVVIACGLAMDAFAVALGAGASGQISGKRAAFRLSFHFGLFQFMMPVLGWLLAIRFRHFH